MPRRTSSMGNTPVPGSAQRAPAPDIHAVSDLCSEDATLPV